MDKDTKMDLKITILGGGKMDNPKKSALSSMADSYANDSKDNGSTENTDSGSGKSCCITCSCGSDLLCANCNKPTCDCTC